MTLSSHLRYLESESIYIFREAVAEAQNPVMLYSIGKDSAVLLHIALKSFYPSRLPFPLLHVDTRWKFQDMYTFRDNLAKDNRVKLIIHTHPEAIERNINPFQHDLDTYINVTKTEGLKHATEIYKFDVLFGGARRDEEKARAKERIFSFRNINHRWDPKNQRPELWNLYNTRKNIGESIRVFPLSNWTELDIWHYIYQEKISVVPLYFSKVRPVVRRDNRWLMVDDERFQFLPNETISQVQVRFRSLGCYPLTAAIESRANNIESLMEELIQTKKSERQGRVVDHASPHSLEQKKQEGHF